MCDALPQLRAFDHASLVANDEMRSQTLHHGQHPQRIGQLERSTSEEGADEVAVPRPHAQLAADRALNDAHAGNLDASEQEGRPQVRVYSLRAGVDCRG
jgi:hypothetical protein